MRINCDDVLSRSTARDIVTHNTMWARENGVPLPPVKKTPCPAKPATPVQDINS
jgi:hypothetical protein